MRQTVASPLPQTLINSTYFSGKEGESESQVDEAECIRWKLKNGAVGNIVFLH